MPMHRLTMIHDSPLIASRPGERDGDKAIAAKLRAAAATRARSGLDKPIPVGAAAIYTVPNSIEKIPCMIVRSWPGIVGWTYVIAFGTGQELTAVTGERLTAKGVA